MRTDSRLSFIALAATLSCVVGCRLACGSPEYSMGFYDDTLTEITACRVEWQAGGHAEHEDLGILSPRETAVSHQQPRPIPAKATVKWKTADGKPHIQEVEIAKLIVNVPQFAGTIYFKFIADDRVIVVPMTYTEIDHMADLRQGIIPPSPPATSQPATRPSE